MKPGSILKEKQIHYTLRMRRMASLRSAQRAAGLQPPISGKVANPRIFIVISFHPDCESFAIYDFADGNIKIAHRIHVEENYEVIS